MAMRSFAVSTLFHLCASLFTGSFQSFHLAERTALLVLLAARHTHCSDPRITVSTSDFHEPNHALSLSSHTSDVATPAVFRLGSGATFLERTLPGNGGRRQSDPEPKQNTLQQRVSSRIGTISELSLFFCFLALVGLGFGYGSSKDSKQQDKLKTCLLYTSPSPRD